MVDIMGKYEGNPKRENKWICLDQFIKNQLSHMQSTLAFPFFFFKSGFDAGSRPSANWTEKAALHLTFCHFAFKYHQSHLPSYSDHLKLPREQKKLELCGNSFPNYGWHDFGIYKDCLKKDLWHLCNISIFLSPRYSKSHLRPRLTLS